MNTYIKTAVIALIAVAASALVTARSAEPETVVLPSPVVAGLLQYLDTRPYREVTGLVSSLQRCLQDQVPDNNGSVAERGACPEIAIPLRQLKVPLSKAPPKATHP